MDRSKQFQHHIFENYNVIGKSFTPRHVEVLDENTIIVIGECSAFNGQLDQICLEHRLGGWFWVDMSRMQWLGDSIEDAYHELTNNLDALSALP